MGQSSNEVDKKIITTKKSSTPPPRPARTGVSNSNSTLQTPAPNVSAAKTSVLPVKNASTEVEPSNGSPVKAVSKRGSINQIPKGIVTSSKQFGATPSSSLKEIKQISLDDLLKQEEADSKKNVITSVTQSTTAEVIKQTSVPIKRSFHANTLPSNLLPVVEKNTTSTTETTEVAKNKVINQQRRANTQPSSMLQRPQATVGNTESKTSDELRSNENNGSFSLKVPVQTTPKSNNVSPQKTIETTKSSNNVINANENASIPKGFKEELRLLEEKGHEFEELVAFLEREASLLESHSENFKTVAEENIAAMAQEVADREVRAKNLRALSAFVLLNEGTPYLEHIRNRINKNNNVEFTLTECLKKLKIDVNYFNYRIGKALLHEAVVKENLEFVGALLENDANPDIKGRSKPITALMYLFLGNTVNSYKPLEKVNEAILEILLNKGASISYEDKGGKKHTALDYFEASCEKSNKELIKDKQKRIQKRLLDSEAQKKNKNKVENNGVEVFYGKQKVRPTWRVPPTPAELYNQLVGNANEFKILISFFESFYDPKNKKYKRDVPVGNNILPVLLEVMHQLIRAKRHEAEPINDVITYFDKLLEENKSDDEITKFIVYLKNIGFNLNFVDYQGESFIHKAMNKGRGKIVAALLQNKEDPNIKNKDGLAPLHRPFINGKVIPLQKINVEMAVMLLEKCDISVVDKSGKKAIDYLEESYCISDKSAETTALYKDIKQKFEENRQKFTRIYEARIAGFASQLAEFRSRDTALVVDTINEGIYDEDKVQLRSLVCETHIEQFIEDIEFGIEHNKRRLFIEQLESLRQEFLEKFTKNDFQKDVIDFYEKAKSDWYRRIGEMKKKIADNKANKSRTELKDIVDKDISRIVDNFSMQRISNSVKKDCKNHLKQIKKEFCLLIDQGKWDDLQELNVSFENSSNLKEGEKGISSPRDRSRGLSFRGLQKILSSSSDKLPTQERTPPSPPPSA